MPLLELRDVARRYGALAAVAGVSCAVHEGEIVGLIGPNGAGKSTLVGLISGAIPPSGGQLWFDGVPLNGLEPYQRAALGIARTFQIPRPFTGLTVAENVLVPALFAPRAGRERARERVAELLELVGLGDLAQAPAELLTVTQRKRLELARALALRPRLLLLDEVMAGLNPVEVEALIALARRLNREGITIVLVEHLMRAVMALSQRVLVLHHGRLIADGTPEQVTADPAVVQAYLGRRYARASGA